MKPKILIVAAGIATDNPDLAGGDMRYLEIARHWIQKGADVHMLTPKGGETLCLKFGVAAKIHLLPKSKADGRWQAVFDTLLLPFRVPASIFKENFQAVYSTNEQLYDVIPALMLKRKHGKNIQWATVVHWLPPFPPWKRHRSTVLHSCLFFFSERLSVWVAKHFADKLLPVSQATEKQLLDVHVPSTKIQMVECGLPLDAVKKAAAIKPSKVYDAVFMKRVQAVKGALDLPAIWKKVIEKRPQSKLLVIGYGEDFEQLKSIVKEQGLDQNIELAGVIYDLDKKFSLLCQSRLFILPSYEENWAIVIGEAMGAELPVVAYGLSELNIVWKDNYIPVPVGNTDRFAAEIVTLLENDPVAQALAAKARAYVERLDWSKIAEREWNAILPSAPLEKSPTPKVLTGASSH